MRIYNPKDEDVQFCHGGVWEYLRAKESRDFPEQVAVHALERSRVGLVEYTPMYDREMKLTDISYPNMPWRKLVSLASARGVFRPGIKRSVLEKTLEDYDEERRTLQKPSD